MRSTVPDSFNWPTGTGIRIAFDPSSDVYSEQLQAILTEPLFRRDHATLGPIVAYWMVSGSMRRANIFADLQPRREGDNWEIAQSDLRFHPALIAAIDQPEYADLFDGVATFDLQSPL